MKTSEKARVLIAMGVQKTAVVITTDSEWVIDEVEAIGSSYCDDIGILDAADYDAAPGVYLWEGTLKMVFAGAYDSPEPETAYAGKLRPVELRELKSLLAMEPPQTPLTEIIDYADACPHCGVSPRPSLEHKDGCPVRLEFYGGNTSWDQTMHHAGKDGAVFEFDRSMKTWRPRFPTQHRKQKDEPPPTWGGTVEADLRSKCGGLGCTDCCNGFVQPEEKTKTVWGACTACGGEQGNHRIGCPVNK